jgi:hypothetical protein
MPHISLSQTVIVINHPSSQPRTSNLSTSVNIAIMNGGTPHHPELNIRNRPSTQGETLGAQTSTATVRINGAHSPQEGDNGRESVGER